MSQQFNLAPYYVQRMNAVLGSLPEDYLLVSIDRQELLLVEKRCITTRFTVSTSAKGRGCRVNSFQTPTGIHSIAARIGTDAPKYTIFRDRISTGRIWRPGEDAENMILTRIVRLKGLEPGVNVGPGIDTFERYIYIHGTNREDIIGTPFSHGCVCMRNEDILKLFDLVWEDMIVIID